MADRLEHKVERIFTDPVKDRIEAVLYRQVDPIGETFGYIMHLIFSGEKIFHIDMEELLQYQPEATK